MSITPTAGSAAPNSSGRWFSTAPTSRPPLLPPAIASFGAEVYLSPIRYSAAAMKSSKTFCFSGEPAGVVPVLAVLAAAAQAGDGVDAAHLEPGDRARREGRRHRDVEAAVAGEQRRVLAVARRPLARGDEQRDPRAVLRGIEDLHRLVGGRIEGQLRLAEDRARARGRIAAEDRGRAGEGRERVEELAVAPASRHRHVAEAGQGDLALARPVLAVDRQQVVRVHLP